MQKTWWGRSFIASLESFIDAGRLQRGRVYRSDKRILAFTINDSQINATVRGNINPYFNVTREPKYEVALKFNRISAEKWQVIIGKLCENPGWLSKLMLNELPGNIENAFDRTHFLPKSYDDIDAQCSCPDYANPCKHIAGVYYRLANILDSDPMLLFQLRGLAPEALHNALKKTPLGQVFSEHISALDQIEIRYQTFKFSECKTSKTAKNASLEQYWTMGDWSLPPRDEEAHEINALSIKKQGDYPIFWSKQNSFIGAMEDIYSTVKKKNKKSLL